MWGAQEMLVVNQEWYLKCSKWEDMSRDRSELSMPGGPYCIRWYSFSNWMVSRPRRTGGRGEAENLQETRGSHYYQLVWKYLNILITCMTVPLGIRLVSLMIILAEEYSSGGMTLLFTLNNFFMLMTHKFASPALFCSMGLFDISTWMSYGHIKLNISKAEFLISPAEVLLLSVSFSSQLMVPGTWYIFEVMISLHVRGSIAEWIEFSGARLN